MYGLVNRAIKDLLTAEFGAECWETVKQAADVNVKEFEAMTPYPDHVTYRLVGAAAEELGRPAEEILTAFGEYWIRYSAEEGYGALMRLWGQTFIEFVENLDNLHRRVQQTFPLLEPPSFRCDDVTEGSFRLHYQSSREGLAPFVIGLLKGLGKRFEVDVTATLETPRPPGGDVDIFFVRYQPLSANAQREPE